MGMNYSSDTNRRRLPTVIVALLVAVSSAIAPPRPLPRNALAPPWPLQRLEQTRLAAAPTERTRLSAAEGLDGGDALVRVMAWPLSPRQVNGAILGGLGGACFLALFHTDIYQSYELWRHDLLAVESPLEVFSRFPADWLEWYDDSVLAHPLAAKAATSGACYFAGDLLAQSLKAPDRPLDALDLPRASRSAAAGFVGHGPVAHYWLQFMDSLDFGPGVLGALPKIALDQGPMSIFYNTVYTLLIGAFALRRPADVLDDVRSTWLPGMLVSLRFWPLIHLVTFSTLIPPELKLLWVDAMEVIWIAILSKVNNDDYGKDGPSSDIRNPVWPPAPGGGSK
mmetsp:Transcript_3859/g.11416  ORF Transcript_3859/g.11416 Transcript_3859/m.11416 type:complete len:338 (-) Transcript_3859:21-1034(-)